MKLTARSEYALLALIFIARQEHSEFTSVKVISESMKIPPKFLEQIVLVLKRAGYLTSVKGQYGGFRLAKPAKKITIAAVVRLFDGALAPTESVSKYFYRRTPIAREKSLLKLFQEIRNFVSDLLEKTTIADLI